MDGVGSAQGGILVLGATNVPWELDPGIDSRKTSKNCVFIFELMQFLSFLIYICFYFCISIFCFNIFHFLLFQFIVSLSILFLRYLIPLPLSFSSFLFPCFLLPSILYSFPPSFYHSSSLPSLLRFFYLPILNVSYRSLLLFFLSPSLNPSYLPSFLHFLFLPSCLVFFPHFFHPLNLMLPPPLHLFTAMRRRFQKRVYIALPEARARAHMLKLNLGLDY
jgi:hypothetical protein